MYIVYKLCYINYLFIPNSIIIAMTIIVYNCAVSLKIVSTHWFLEINKRKEKCEKNLQIETSNLFKSVPDFSTKRD